MKADTVLRDCFIVHLYDGDEMLLQILWGYVEVDPSGRWPPDSYVSTSPVLKNTDDGFYLTRNSVYQVLGVLELIRLPYQAITLLRAGISPKECLLNLQLEKEGQSNARKH